MRARLQRDEDTRRTLCLHNWCSELTRRQSGSTVFPQLSNVFNAEMTAVPSSPSRCCFHVYIQPDAKKKKRKMHFVFMHINNCTYDLCLCSTKEFTHFNLVMQPWLRNCLITVVVHGGKLTACEDNCTLLWLKNISASVLITWCNSFKCTVHFLFWLSDSSSEVCPSQDDLIL